MGASDARPPTTMVDPNPPRPPWSVGEMLRTGRFPNNLFEAVSARFRDTKEDVGLLLTEKRSGRGVHYFLAHLASRMDPVPGFDQVALLQVNPDGTVHLLNSYFTVLVGLYSTARRVFACCRYLPKKGLLPMVELPVDAFGVWRSVRAVPRADHVSHL